MEADEAMARGDVRQAESLLDLAAQRGHDAATLLRLATVRRSLGDYPGAIKAASAAVELEPRNFLMCLLLGSLREVSDAPHAAERAYRAACAHAPVALPFQPAMAKQMERAKRWVESADQWRSRLLNWAPSSGKLTSGEARRMRGFRNNVLENLDSGATAPPAFVIPEIRAVKYFAASQFAGIAEIERNTAEIREEFVALAGMRNDISHRLSGLHGADNDTGREGAWSMIPLMKGGKLIEEFASLCPRTMTLVQALDMPRLSLISPSVYFSVLEPRSKIAPHTGLTNARAIAHFPLVVPDHCGFRVGGETRVWEEGKALIFDDMTTHEAWNDSDRIRVVLIVDLWRPELSAAERQSISELMDWPGVEGEA